MACAACRRATFALFPVVVFLMSSAAAGGPAPTRFTYTEPHMGTRFKIILYAADQATAGAASKAAFARVAALDAMMSDYRPDSELMRLCRRAGGDPVPVSDELFFVLSRAQEVSRLSDGAFDVTVGPIVKLWRRARRTGRLPDPDELKHALALVGWEKVRLDPKAHTVRLLAPGMQLDLGGIAKGYAADEALRTLEGHHVTRALVAASGDIAVSGPPPDADGWKVGIAPLEDADGTPKRFLILKDAAVSTSGDAEQYVEIDGKRYSHIVDPKSGIGLVGRMSATVVARRGIMADSLTKVVAVLGERGLAVIDRLDEGTAAQLVRKTDRGEEVLTSKRWPEVHRKE
jgi:thiamine biosynthesis lipoprotein